MTKTPFTHEGLIERGFVLGHNWYSMSLTEMDLSISAFYSDRPDTWILHITARMFPNEVESPEIIIHQPTTITTLEDLDIFLSYIKHD